MLYVFSDISAGTFNFENKCGEGGSYAEYDLGSNEVVDISFHVKTIEDSGLIYQHGVVNEFEIILKIFDSKLVLHLGTVDHTTDFVISDGNPHKIVLNYGRDSDKLSLHIDESFSKNWTRPKDSFGDDILEAIKRDDIYFNHQPANLQELDLKSFKGCISDVRLTVIGNTDGIPRKLSLRFSEDTAEVGGYTPTDFTNLVCVEPQCKSDDMCQTNPCSNGAACETTWNEYTCDCVDGFAGENCENTDYCSSTSNSCPDKETCTNVAGGFECHDFVSFSQTSSSVKASVSEDVKTDLLSSVQLTIRTREKDALLFFMEGSGGCYISAQLKEENIQVHFKFDQSTAQTVEVVKNLADGEINVIEIDFSALSSLKLTMNDDETFSRDVTQFQQPTLECLASDRILIGGLGDQDSIQDQQSKIPNSPPVFNGCISNFRINDLFVPLHENAVSASLNNFTFQSSSGTVLGCPSEDSCSGVNCNDGTCRNIWRSYKCDCNAGKALNNCITFFGEQFSVIRRFNL